jgi:hypothetical protein
MVNSPIFGKSRSTACRRTCSPGAPRVRWLEEAGDRAILTREAAALEADFLAGRWVLDRGR